MHGPPTPTRLAAGLLAIALLVACDPPPGDATTITPTVRADRRTSIASWGAIAEAVRAQARDVPVEGSGTVVRVLRDDREGSAHQKFLLRLPEGGTVLVAHNIDLAPHLDGLAEGDTVAFRGEYVWTPKGGTVHWTHRDPGGRHPGGWLRWQGRTYD